MRTTFPARLRGRPPRAARRRARRARPPRHLAGRDHRGFRQRLVRPPRVQVPRLAAGERNDVRVTETTDGRTIVSDTSRCGSSATARSTAAGSTPPAPRSARRTPSRSASSSATATTPSAGHGVRAGRHRLGLRRQRHRRRRRQRHDLRRHPPQRRRRARSSTAAAAATPRKAPPTCPPARPRPSRPARASGPRPRQRRRASRG